MIGERNDVTRISRADGTSVVLRPVAESMQDPPRNLLTLDGDHVFFHEGRSLLRMNKDGSNLLEIASGTEADWVVPMTLGIGDQHAYFERITKLYTQRTNADGNLGFDSTYLGSLQRAPR